MKSIVYALYKTKNQNYIFLRQKPDYDEKQITAAGLIFHNLACSFKYIKCEFGSNLFKDSGNGT